MHQVICICIIRQFRIEILFLMMSYLYRSDALIPQGKANVEKRLLVTMIHIIVINRFFFNIDFLLRNHNGRFHRPVWRTCSYNAAKWLRDFIKNSFLEAPPLVDGLKGPFSESGVICPYKTWQFTKYTESYPYKHKLFINLSVFFQRRCLRYS